MILYSYFSVTLIFQVAIGSKVALFNSVSYLAVSCHLLLPERNFFQLLLPEGNFLYFPLKIIITDYHSLAKP